MESQDDSQGNSLVAVIEHSPDNGQLIGESLDKNEGSKDRAIPGQPCKNQKGKEKQPIDQTLH